MKATIAALLLATAGCGKLDATIGRIGLGGVGIPEPPDNQQRPDPDFLPGEVVKSPNAYEIRAVIGEIAPEPRVGRANPYESLNDNGWTVQAIISYNP